MPLRNLLSPMTSTSILSTAEPFSYEMWSLQSITESGHARPESAEIGKEHAQGLRDVGLVLADDVDRVRAAQRVESKGVRAVELDEARVHVPRRLDDVEGDDLADLRAEGRRGQCGPGEEGSEGARRGRGAHERREALVEPQAAEQVRQQKRERGGGGESEGGEATHSSHQLKVVELPNHMCAASCETVVTTCRSAAAPPTFSSYSKADLRPVTSPQFSIAPASKSSTTSRSSLPSSYGRSNICVRAM